MYGLETIIHFKQEGEQSMANENDLVMQLFEHATLSLAKGKSKKAIISDFIENGIPHDSAIDIVSHASNYKKREFRKSGVKTIGIGTGLLALGGLITSATYTAAGAGDTYIVTTGLFAVGAIIIIKGLWRCIVG